MRPIATEQDHVRYPLNELLGTRANVRLLRFLAEEASGPVSVPEAASHAGLTEAGARRALQRLAETGFVERSGGGRTQQFKMREGDPLVRQLRSLFSAERDRYESFIVRLRELFESFEEIPLAWIDDPPPEPGRTLHIGVLAESRSLPYLRDEIRARILSLEHEYDVTIELHLFSRADVPDVRWQTATILVGLVRDASVASTGMRTHSERMDRASKISELIADMLDRNPSLKKRAVRHLDKLLERGEGAASHDLREWREILTHYSHQRIKDLLVSDTPRAQRLRQSSPFFAVLTANEREELLKAVE